MASMGASMWRKCGVVALTAGAVTACAPPAADGYVERVDLAESRDFASEPLPSPDTEGAVWVATDLRPGIDARLVYGVPGAAPLLALECSAADDGTGQLEFTRFARADAKAQALMALVGNGHVARVPVDAEYNGRAWLWRGVDAADRTEFNVLTGPRDVTVTVPGAGLVKLNASPLPGELVSQCRAAPPEQDLGAETEDLEQDAPEEEMEQEDLD
ncbi:hypothetical protein HME9302_00680 [Alteripontixanthobacter maritimus]|uniref:Uncharacterized protein n=1 Tax=Alteripontixanthobacter maritimus TaxID=2161824 RepID=A0A369Q4Y3_9SPHN|nr:hypothetical protein [Alteripontixanthobacter maritimus]RDC59490.1 hypothetical protein HME9302_00680 [Alteripontixanthobacter maritimus]